MDYDNVKFIDTSKKKNKLLLEIKEKKLISVDPRIVDICHKRNPSKILDFIIENLT